MILLQKTWWQNINICIGFCSLLSLKANFIQRARDLLFLWHRIVVAFIFLGLHHFTGGLMCISYMSSCCLCSASVTSLAVLCSLYSCNPFRLVSAVLPGRLLRPLSALKSSGDAGLLSLSTKLGLWWVRVVYGTGQPKGVHGVSDSSSLRKKLYFITACVPLQASDKKSEFFT